MRIQIPSEFTLATTDTLIFLVVGAIAGFLASRVVRGWSQGILLNMIIGIIGAFLGRWLFGIFAIDLGPGIIPMVIVAFVGAAILLMIVRALSGGYRGARRRYY